MRFVAKKGKAAGPLHKQVFQSKTKLKEKAKCGGHSPPLHGAHRFLWEGAHSAGGPQ